MRLLSSFKIGRRSRPTDGIANGEPRQDGEAASRFIDTWLKFMAAAVVIAAFGLTIEVVRVRAVRTGDREAMRIGMEDVASRVRTTEANLARTVELNNRSAIAKAHALALLIAEDPTLVDDHERFIALRKPLDVEEIHVSDENGILIQCYPETSLGLDMNSAEQPRPFMAALTNKTFELVQEPQTNRVIFKVFQYAGVARVDKPGIVQIGYSANRVAEARFPISSAAANRQTTSRCSRSSFADESAAVVLLRFTAPADNMV